MGGNKYPEFDKHTERHKELVNSIQSLQSKLDNDDEELNLADFFTKWLIDHIFKDDKNFSAHLKKEEIYF
jgi:hemerythrin-like metal-binding protein